MTRNELIQGFGACMEFMGRLINELEAPGAPAGGDPLPEDPTSPAERVAASMRSLEAAGIARRVDTEATKDALWRQAADAADPDHQVGEGD